MRKIPELMDQTVFAVRSRNSRNIFNMREGQHSFLFSSEDEVAPASASTRTSLFPRCPLRDPLLGSGTQSKWFHLADPEFSYTL